MTQASPRVAIVGGGPIGIEAALAASERGWPFTVYEASGSVAGHVGDWGHVRLFSPWEMNVSPRARRVLGDAAPVGAELPTGDELVDRVLRPLAESLGDRVRVGARVRAIAREGLLKHEEISSDARGRRPFRLLVRGPDGGETRRARRRRRRLQRGLRQPERARRRRNPRARRGGAGRRASAAHAVAGARCRRLGRPADSLDGVGPLCADRRARAGRAGRSRRPVRRSSGRFAATTGSFGAVADDALPGASLVERGRGVTGRGWLGGGRRPLRRGDRATAACATAACSCRCATASVDELEVDRVLALNGGVGDASIYRQLQVHECYATAAPMKLSAALLAQSGAAGGDCLAVEPLGPETLAEPGAGLLHPRSEVVRPQQPVPDADGLAAGGRRLRADGGCVGVGGVPLGRGARARCVVCLALRGWVRLGLVCRWRGRVNG